jgi:putrescine importer
MARMARAYPSAGSAFTYVGQEINPALGYVTGWSMVMDYMLNPMICIIWCSQQARLCLRPGFPTGVGPFSLRSSLPLLNLQGVKTSARVNTRLAAGMGAVIAFYFFMVAGALYFWVIRTTDPGFFTRPFYDPGALEHQSRFGGDVDRGADVHWVRWHLDALGRSGKSTAQYFAGDGADLPGHRNSFSGRGLCRAIDLARHAAVSERGHGFYFVAGRAWKLRMFGILGFTLLVANFGSGMGAQIGAARLLYGMGRSKALPQNRSSARSIRSGTCPATT